MMVGFRNLENVSTDTLIWTNLDFVYHNNLNTIMIQQCNKINSMVLGLVFLTHSDLINHAEPRRKEGLLSLDQLHISNGVGLVLKYIVIQHHTFMKLFMSSFLAPHLCDQYFTLVWKSPTLPSEGFKNWFIFGFWKVLKVSVGRLLQTYSSC